MFLFHKIAKHNNTSLYIVMVIIVKSRYTSDNVQHAEQVTLFNK